MFARGVLWSALAAVVAVGCASGTASRNVATFRVGSAYEASFSDMVPRIMNRHGYSVHRTTTSSDLVTIESDWHDRDALYPELEAGFEQARTRLVLQARPVRSGPVAPTSRTGYLFHLDLRVESLGYRADGRWVPIQVTPAFRELIAPLVRDMELQFRTGVRVY